MRFAELATAKVIAVFVKSAVLAQGANDGLQRFPRSCSSREKPDPKKNEGEKTNCENEGVVLYFVSECGRLSNQLRRRAE